jgi:diguanylate cyclase (GGDEF)-like protein
MVHVNKVTTNAVVDELRWHACFDTLTDLANRRHFQSLGEAEFLRSQLCDCDLALILLDLDHFNRVNDYYGHGCGDEVLAETAACLRQRLRCQDVIGRWGGEEFALLLPETDVSGALIVAEEVRTIVADHAFHYEDVSLKVTISLGVAVRGTQHEEFADLIASSDKQLRRAKRLGRNRVCLGE